jgi:hypothetical protein
MNANIRTIGGSIGAALTASIVMWHADPAGIPTEAGYVIAFAVLAGSLGLATVTEVLVPKSTEFRHDVADERELEQLAVVAVETVAGDESE